MEATKVRLEAVAYLPGTDGSNPFLSSGESIANLIPLLGATRTHADQDGCRDKLVTPNAADTSSDPGARADRRGDGVAAPCRDGSA
jgi:hypothetical protein